MRVFGSFEKENKILTGADTFNVRMPHTRYLLSMNMSQHGGLASVSYSVWHNGLVGLVPFKFL